MKLGDKIKMLRAEKNLTQKQLAKLAGVSTVSLNYIENDKHTPTALTIGKLAKALQVNINELLNL